MHYSINSANKCRNRRYRYVAIIFLALMSSAGMASSAFAQAERLRIPLRPVAYSGSNGQIGTFVRQTNSVLKECHLKGRVSNRSIAAMENAATSLARRAIAQGQEDETMTAIRDAVSLLWIARYNCVN